MKMLKSICSLKILFSFKDILEKVWDHNVMKVIEHRQVNWALSQFNAVAQQQEQTRIKNVNAVRYVSAGISQPIWISYHLTQTFMHCHTQQLKHSISHLPMHLGLQKLWNAAYLIAQNKYTDEYELHVV